MFTSQSDRAAMMSLLSPATGLSNNFGQMNLTPNPNPNQLTPTPLVQRPSRRSFTPNMRAITPPSFSPINRSNMSNLDDYDSPWNSFNSFNSIGNNSKMNDDDPFGLTKINGSSATTDRFPTFLKPSRIDPLANSTLCTPNQTPNGGAISK